MFNIKKCEMLTEEEKLERTRNRIKKELNKLGLSDDERRTIKRKKKISKKEPRQLSSTCDSDETDSSRDDNPSYRKKSKDQKTKSSGLDLNEKHSKVKRSRDRESASPFADRSLSYERAGTSLQTGPTPSRTLAPDLEHDRSRVRQDRSRSRHSSSRSRHGRSRSRDKRSQSMDKRSQSRDKRCKSSHGRSQSRDKWSQSSQGISKSRYGCSSATSPDMGWRLHERRGRYEPSEYRPNISEQLKPSPKEARSYEMDRSKESNIYIEWENVKRHFVEELAAKQKEAVKEILLDIEKPLNKFSVENNATEVDRKRVLHKMFKLIRQRMEGLDAKTVGNLIMQYRCTYSLVDDEFKLTELFNDVISTRHEATEMASESSDDLLLNDLDSILQGLDLALLTEDMKPKIEEDGEEEGEIRNIIINIVPTAAPQPASPPEGLYTMHDNENGYYVHITVPPKRQNKYYITIKRLLKTMKPIMNQFTDYIQIELLMYVMRVELEKRIEELLKDVEDKLKANQVVALYREKYPEEKDEESIFNILCSIWRGEYNDSDGTDGSTGVKVSNLSVAEKDNVPEVSNLGVVKKENDSLPEVSNLGVVKKEKDNVPEVPNLGVGKKGKGNVPEVPNLGVGKKGKGNVPEVPNLGVGKKGKGNVPEVYNFGVVKIEKDNVPEVSDHELDQANEGKDNEQQVFNLVRVKKEKDIEPELSNFDIAKDTNQDVLNLDIVEQEKDNEQEITNLVGVKEEKDI